MSRYSLSLLENSKGFFQESIRNAVNAERDQQVWKYAIIFAVQAVELALKEHLRRAHFLLVFDDVDKCKHTVSLEKALHRIAAAHLATVSSEDLAAIRIAAEWRNAVIHFEIPEEVSEEISNLKLVLARLLGFYCDYCSKKLEFDPKESLAPRLFSELLAIEQYRSELIARASARMEAEAIDSNHFVWPCPDCGADSFVVQDGIDTCYVCGFAETVVECDRCKDTIFESDVHRLHEEDYFGRFTKVCERCRSILQDPWDGLDD